MKRANSQLFHQEEPNITQKRRVSVGDSGADCQNPDRIFLMQTNQTFCSDEEVYSSRSPCQQYSSSSTQHCFDSDDDSQASLAFSFGSHSSPVKTGQNAISETGCKGFPLDPKIGLQLGVNNELVQDENLVFRCESPTSPFYKYCTKMPVKPVNANLTETKKDVPLFQEKWQQEKRKIELRDNSSTEHQALSSRECPLRQWSNKNQRKEKFGPDFFVFDEYDLLINLTGNDPANYIGTLLKTEIVYPPNNVAKIPDISNSSTNSRAVCNIWNPNKITRTQMGEFSTSVAGLVEIPEENITEEKLTSILRDFNYDPSKAYHFCADNLSYMKSFLKYPDLENQPDFLFPLTRQNLGNMQE